MDPRALAKALREIGRKNVPEDTRLVYVNDSEYDYLTQRSGRGEPDPDTGIEHFDEGYSSDNGDGGSVGSGSGNDAGPSDSGGAVDENAAITSGNYNQAGPDGSFTDSQGNVFSSAEMAAQAEAAAAAQAEDAAARAAYDAKYGGLGFFDQLGGGRPSGEYYGLTQEQFASANPDMASKGFIDSLGNYHSYINSKGGEEEAIDENAYGGSGKAAGQAAQASLDAFNSSRNNAGYVGQTVGTLFDVGRGMLQGAQYGPLGASVYGVISGLRGNTGDMLSQSGRDAVSSSLADGTWSSGMGSAGADSGGGSDEAYMGGSPSFNESGGPAKATGPTKPAPRTGWTRTAYAVNALRSPGSVNTGPQYGQYDLDYTPLEGVRRRREV